MGGFSFLNVPDYQKRLDILAGITPFRPGMFVSSNQDEILRLCDGQIEIAEDELKRWAERHSEEGNAEIRCRIVGANPLKVKILDYDADHEQVAIRDNWKKRRGRDDR